MDDYSLILFYLFLLQRFKQVDHERAITIQEKEMERDHFFRETKAHVPLTIDETGIQFTEEYAAIFREVYQENEKFTRKIYKYLYFRIDIYR